MLQVQFQVGVSNATSIPRAMNIISRRALLRGHIESIKDQVTINTLMYMYMYMIIIAIVGTLT